MKEVYRPAVLLKEHFPINFARIMLISQIIIAVIKVRTVTLTEIAAGFAGKTETASNERRIRRFFSDFSINPDFVSLFVASILPEGKWLLTVDRTEWQFGKTEINILMLAVVYKGVAIPLLWKLLTKKDDPDAGKKGSSNTGERKDLMKHFIRLFGTQRIESVAADREFIGNQWFQRLKENNINIAVRIRENQKVTNSRGLYTRASDLFRNLKPGESRILKGLRKIGDSEVFVGGMKCVSGEFFIAVTFCCPEKMFEIYAKRWQIETMSACLKTRGFRFESTRLRDPERINRLLSIVAAAFVWAYLTGEIKENKKQTVIKKHGYRAKSIFRNGFDHPRRIFLNMNEYADEFSKVTKIFSVPAVYFFKFHQLCDLK